MKYIYTNSSKLKELPFIDPDISKAKTPPGSFYTDPDVFDLQMETIFSKSWNGLFPIDELDPTHNVYPFFLLGDALNEPLVITKDETGSSHCLSNVCTHRASLVVTSAGNSKLLSCPYHGRCFSLTGKFRSMPEFEDVEGFPSAIDDLKSFPLEEFCKMYFTSLDPQISFTQYIAPVTSRIGWLPFQELEFVPRQSKDYLLDANWMLYCDNYLEGFHIPFVHPGLNSVLDKSAYEVELLSNGILQIGVSKPGENAYDIPESAQDHGRSILAFYYFLFPNLMLNFYPWGLSANFVEPVSVDKTKIRFLTFKYPRAKEEEVNSGIHQTEMEDEEIVRSVQAGVRSRAYQYGRYSPTMENGVHHFHRLVLEALTSDKSILFENDPSVEIGLDRE